MLNLLIKLNVQQQRRVWISWGSYWGWISNWLLIIANKELYLLSHTFSPLFLYFIDSHNVSYTFFQGKPQTVTICLPPSWDYSHELSLVIWDRVSLTCAWAGLKSGSSHLCPVSNWDYKHRPPCPDQPIFVYLLNFVCNTDANDSYVELLFWKMCFF
jgi:hypothetical protein